MKIKSISQAQSVDQQVKLELPLFLSNIHAGFPSPADDYFDNKLDLNEFLVKKPASTYFVKVSGDSMTGAGIFSGDILVVDRSLHADDNKIVIAMIDGEFLVKRLKKHNGKVYLISENSKYPPIEVKENDLTVWGVVTYTIHKPK